MGAIGVPHANGRHKFQYFLKLFKYCSVQKYVLFDVRNTGTGNSGVHRYIVHVYIHYSLGLPTMLFAMSSSRPPPLRVCALQQILDSGSWSPGQKRDNRAGVQRTTLVLCALCGLCT